MSSIKAFFHAALPALLLMHTSHGFAVHPQRSAPSNSVPSNDVINSGNAPVNRIDSLRLDASVEEGDANDNGIQMVSLEGLGDDHEAVGETMAKSIAAWLDDEWLPQEVHVKMGTSVKNTYVSCRSKGIDDVAEIMTEVTDDLFERWAEYDADAFVNAWDVGNYVADYLIAKSGSETCGCSTQIVE